MKKYTLLLPRAPSVRPVGFTRERIRAFKCAQDKPQAFLRDANTRGLAVRATRNGAKAFVFEGRLRGLDAPIRLTIGSVHHWDIDSADPMRPGARQRARYFAQLCDRGIDPRETIREQAAATAASQIIAREAWNAYVEKRTASGEWGPHHIADHHSLAKSGGERRRRWKGKKTEPGILAPILDMRLGDIDADTVTRWLRAERKVRPTRARKAFVLLSTFLAWAAEQDAYRVAVRPGACGKSVRAFVPKAGKRTDCLQRAQLPAFFAVVRALPGAVHAAYLQTLLLVGARSHELADLRLDEVDFRRGTMTLAVRAASGRRKSPRTLPLTPYVATLIGTLRRIEGNPYLFASPSSKSGHIDAPGIALDAACHVAGIPDLTPHGLRRSFGTLAEWLNPPSGLIRQIQGRVPAANDTAEGHYRVRELDFLRQWHEQIETWFLAEAGIGFEAVRRAPELAVVIDNTTAAPSKAAWRAARRIKAA